MTRLAAALLVAAVGSAWILTTFHDRSWWPPDEGQYAHVAERVLDGDVLHRDVLDPHPDYGHFLNAAAFAACGRDLVSLRYPLAFLGWVNALLVLALLRGRSPELAACAALAVAALSFVQFPNPSPNWYGQSLTLAVVVCLSIRSEWRFPAVGFALGLLLGMRQLTGVLVGIGAVAYLLVETRNPGGGAQSRVARAVLFVMLAAVCAYLARATDLLGWLLFGAWPVGLLCWCLYSAAIPDRVATRMLLRLAAGVAAGLAPEVAYHGFHGSLGAWLHEVLSAARAVPSLAYLGDASYADWLREAGSVLASPTSLAASANAAYWVALLVAGAANGALLIAVLVRGRPGAPGTRLAAALPFIACFHALVSVFNQIPIYLYYTVGLSLAGIAWSVARCSIAPRVAVGVVLVWLAATGVQLHAAQPHTRSLAEVVAGTRVPLQRNTRVPRASLWMEPDQERVYADLIDAIHARTGPADTLLVVPNDAEIYFLAQRASAVDFWSSALALRTRADERALIQQLRASPPALIVYVRGDKSSTAALGRVLDGVRDLYAGPQSVHYFELWQRAPRAR